jgi:hypothetical protein
MALVTKLTQICDWGTALIIANSEALGIPPNGVFYGDQTRIPCSPCVCVEPGDKKSDLYGAGRMTEVDFTIYFLVYHSEIKAVQFNRRDADALAESICTLLNADGTMGGIAIHSFASEVASGYSTKQNTVMRTSRITFTAKSQERLPNNP